MLSVAKLFLCGLFIELLSSYACCQRRPREGHVKIIRKSQEGEKGTDSQMTPPSSHWLAGEAFETPLCSCSWLPPPNHLLQVWGTFGSPYVAEF